MSLFRFRDVVAERGIFLEPLGFTELQSRFLATGMAHSGVFLERQYCRFAGIAHGQKSHDFIGRLVDCGFARVETTSHLYQGRFYHLHHKRLYSLLGQTDNRNRKRAHRSRMIERLMLLDIVLDDRDVLWLGTESDKVRYFKDRLAQYGITPRELPHLTFGSGPNQVLRPFADKLPVGVDPLNDRYVFTYLVTCSSTNVATTSQYLKTTVDRLQRVARAFDPAPVHRCRLRARRAQPPRRPRQLSNRRDR